MILSKLCPCFWVPFRFKTWRIAKVNGLTLIIIVFIGGSGIVQIQETGNVNRNNINQPEGGKGVGREGERILFSLPLAIFHFLSSSLYFGPFSIIWTPGTGKITASMILLVIFKTVARGWPENWTHDRQTSAPPSELTRGGWYLSYCIYQYTEQSPIKRIISQCGRQKNKTKQKQQKTT